MDRFALAREIAVVAVGGAVGCVARHLTNLATAAWLGDKFPWGHLIVNVIGCLLIGMLGEWYTLNKELPGWLRLLLVTGFLGGLTTFSSFGYDTLRQFESGHVGAALANIGASVILGLFAVWLGFGIVRSLVA